MKIIFVNRYFYPDISATSQILSDLAFQLSGKGNEVCVVTGRQNYHDRALAYAPRETHENVNIFRIWSTRFGRKGLAGRLSDYLTFYLSCFFKLLTLARKGDVAVVMTDPPLIGVVAALAVKLRGAKLVNWTQDVFPETAKILKSRWVRGPVIPFLRWMRNGSLRGAAMNVTIGQRMAEYLLSQRVANEKIRVIHNWSDGDHVKPLGQQHSHLRREWKLDDKFVVGYSGNMGRVHEFETILQAAEILKQEPKFVFLFTAEGFYHDRVRTQAAEKGLVNIVFKPPQPYDKLADGLGASDVHLVCLRKELEGLVVPSKFYGIAAAGLPTLFIGDAHGEIAELVQQNDCGVVVMPGDGRALAASIRELAKNKALCADMGRKARELFERKFEKKYAYQAWDEVMLAVAHKS